MGLGGWSSCDASIRWLAELAPPSKRLSKAEITDPGYSIGIPAPIRVQ